MAEGKILTNDILQTENRSERGDFSIIKPSKLYISDGSVFEGFMSEQQAQAGVGEVVFNTGMTGYVESLTDPSYNNQILVFTYPLLGNYGVQPGDAESDKIRVRGVVVSELDWQGSHSGSSSGLADWLASQNIPVMWGVDTRALTKHLREKGTMLGAISTEPVDAGKLKIKPSFVSVKKPVSYNQQHAKKVILVDCGAKENILRSLLKLPVQVKRVPLDYDYTNEDYDGVVISNGPGNPEDYKPTIAITKQALAGNKPVFGICLGNQLMALAVGAKTYKLKYGHRGHNQPCLEENGQRCYITSQNHGYAIDAGSLPKGWQVSFSNLNDGSVEGIRHSSKPFFSVQFHPEAAPGPTDTHWLFERFYKTL
ncbi:MAG TPA: glutamine-hydrolyzing carbamoyl-phosphate synthase small subunit [Candidatus Saccharimonadales bacterium]|nr:glutamine-hydrolyzing carbamoyl-phosphate synthase small subunit [Candidatus Saccharimonadales bacterium]